MGQSKKLTVSDQRSAVIAAQIDRLKTILSLPFLSEADEIHLQRAAASNDVPFSDIKKAKAWLQTMFPEMFERIQGASESNLFLCLDENCPYQMAIDLHRYGRLTSVDLQGWSGKLDPVILGLAKVNRIDAIIGRDTAQKASRQGKDRDLTNAALDMWDSFFRGRPNFVLGKSDLPPIPVLIQLTSRYPYRDGTLETFEREFLDIRGLIENPTHAIIIVTPSGVSPVAETSLQRLYNLSKKPKPERGQWNLPSEFRNVSYVASGLGQTRNINIETMMQVMREETDSLYRKWIRRNATPSTEDIFDFIERILGRVKKNHPEIAKNADSLMILEMAVRAARNVAIPDRLVLQFKSSGLEYNLDKTAAGMRRLSLAEAGAGAGAGALEPALD
jgi:hypothetical protein